MSAARRYQNPVYPRYFADPFVWRAAGVYHAVGTGPAEAAGTTATAVFPLLRSPDLVHWEPIGHALERGDAALGDTFWAPEVAFHSGTYYLYYSVGFGDRQHHLRVAVSKQPAGPYRDVGAPLTEAGPDSFAIDPHPFRDADGHWYLFHARDFLDSGPRGRAGTALVAQRLEGMTRLRGDPLIILRARHDWQRFQHGRLMYGGVHDWHTLEGPTVHRHAGRYYCLFSGGRWESDRYGVDYAVADAVLGPYNDTGSERGPRILRTIPGEILGPGHNSLVIGPDNLTTFIVYHAWDPAMQTRRMCIDPLFWTEDGPQSPGPTSTPQPIIY